MRDDGALLLTLLLVAIWYRHQVMQWESERAALRAKLRHVRGIRQGRARSMRLLGGRRANGRAISVCGDALLSRANPAKPANPAMSPARRNRVHGAVIKETEGG